MSTETPVKSADKPEPPSLEQQLGDAHSRLIRADGLVACMEKQRNTHANDLVNISGDLHLAQQQVLQLSRRLEESAQLLIEARGEILLLQARSTEP